MKNLLAAILLAAPLGIATAAAASAASGPSGTDTPKAPRTISFRTRDGWTISALYRPPRKGGVTLVLAHGVGSSKSEWSAFADRLAARGVGTLALDLRGHADSQKGPLGPMNYQDFDLTGEWPRAVQDLLAAADWLKSRGIPESRIAFGGASIGANLAAQAAASRPKTPFLLLLSPGPDYRGVPLVLPRAQTLVGASPQDPYAYSTLRPLAKSPRVQTFEAPSGHGVQMFSDPGTLDLAVEWTAAAGRNPKTR